MFAPAGTQPAHTFLFGFRATLLRLAHPDNQQLMANSSNTTQQHHVQQESAEGAAAQLFNRN